MPKTPRRYSDAYRSRMSAVISRPDVQQRRWATYAERHPDRARLITETRAAIGGGTLRPAACDGCGTSNPPPIYDWEAMAVVGWRCYPCRKVRDA